VTTTLILGGGFGGLACARELRTRLSAAHRIVLADRSPRFVVGATKTWVMLGERSAEEVPGRRAALVPEGVEYKETDVLGIDPRRREVQTSVGDFTGDHLVVALGADLDMSAVPGLAEAGHSFYTLSGAVRLRDALAAFSGGRLVLLIPRAPFQCPPAPYEAAILLHAWLQERGIRARTEIEIWTVERAPMSTAGSEMAKAVVGELTARGIAFHPLKKTVSVEGGRRAVRFEDGTETSFDLLIAIPPHRAPRVALEAGLAEPEGWIPTDPFTMRVKTPGVAPHVYAVGDVTSVPLPGRWDPSLPLFLPKAGVFAAAQGEVAAARIASTVLGEAATAVFDGRGFCFIELGEGRAMRADGAFFETPHPVMAARPAGEGAYRDKLEWVAGWLEPVG
jgi:sulfide:quinone oxidoreductase